MTDEGHAPLYVISVAARMVGVHAQTLRYYERLGLVIPSRTAGNLRMYSQRDIALLQRIKSMVEELGVNLAGVEVALRLMGQVHDMSQELESLRNEVDRLSQELASGSRALPTRVGKSFP